MKFTSCEIDAADPPFARILRFQDFLDYEYQALLNGTVQTLEVTVAQQQKQIEALTAESQKVAARVEAGKSDPSVVSDN